MITARARTERKSGMYAKAARLATMKPATTGMRGSPARSASGIFSNHQANQAMARRPSTAVAFFERRKERRDGASVTTSQPARSRKVASA